MDKAKEKIPKEFRIGDTCFTSFANIEGNLYTRHANNINSVHRENKYFLSVIIILGVDVNGGEIVFYDAYNMTDIGKRAHILKHSRGRCVIGAPDKVFHEGSIWTSNRAVLSFILHKSILFHFVYNGRRFYYHYISSEIKINILMMTGVVFFTKRRV